jgi:hypothetical protein
MIIFLDIDGPVQSMRSALSGMKHDPVAVKAINELFQTPGVRVVLSSSVRIYCKEPVNAAIVLERKYSLKGIVFHDAWATGYVMNGDEGKMNGRTKEIQQWMDVNGHEPGETYYAIDDEPVDVPGVTHIVADYNGLPVEAIALIKFLSGKGGKQTADNWSDFVKTRSCIKCLKQIEEEEQEHV